MMYSESESLESSQSIELIFPNPHTIKGAVETGRGKTVHETPGAAEEFPFISNSNQNNQGCHVHGV